MFGWDNVAATVAQVYQVYRQLDRGDCAILEGTTEKRARSIITDRRSAYPSLSAGTTAITMGAARIFRFLRDYIRRAVERIHHPLWGRSECRDDHKSQRHAQRAKCSCIRLPQAARAALCPLAAIQDDHLTIWRGAFWQRSRSIFTSRAKVFVRASKPKLLRLRSISSLEVVAIMAVFRHARPPYLRELAS